VFDVGVLGTIFCHKLFTTVEGVFLGAVQESTISATVNLGTRALTGIFVELTMIQTQSSTAVTKSILAVMWTSTTSFAPCVWSVDKMLSSCIVTHIISSVVRSSACCEPTANPHGDVVNKLCIMSNLIQAVFAKIILNLFAISEYIDLIMPALHCVCPVSLTSG
jgi:hypothetical protein